MRPLAGIGLSESPAALAGAFAVAVWLAWGELSGGFFATRWGLLGAFLVAALALTLATTEVHPDVRTPWRAAMLAALAAFVGWNALSITWAEFPGEAWTGTGKALLYAVSFALFALWAWSTDGMRTVLAFFGLGVVAIGAVSLVRAAQAADGLEQLVDGRLLGPVEYVNASVCLWMAGMWPLLHLAATPRGGALLRGASLGGAGLLVCLCCLGASRGWLFVLPLAAAAHVALARQRLRAVAALALVTAATALALPALLEVADDAHAGQAVEPALDRAALAGLAVAAGLALAGALWALLDRRVRLPRGAHRALGIAVAVAVAGALAVGAAGAAAATDDPRGWVADRWRDFREGEDPVGRDRYASLGTNRWNEWVAAAREFRDHPVAGIGSDNYAAAYLRRREDEAFAPRYPHSWELRLLAQLGVVGTALFLVFAGIAVALALARRRRSDAVGGGAAAAALMVFVYWALHGSLDWFWEIPALSAPAFGLLALAGAPEPAAHGLRRSSSPARLAAALVAVPVCALLLVSWLAAAYQGAGAAVWREDPAAAYARLERAAELNRLSAEPLVVGGIVAMQRAEYERARGLFVRAASREPANWYVHLQLGLIAGERRDYASAAVHLARASELNPLDPRVRLATRLVRDRAPVDPRAVNARFAVGDETAGRGPGDPLGFEPRD